MHGPRIFYGVYIEDIVLTAGLDLIRYLAEPRYYRRTHITVRGPYNRALSKRELQTINEKFEQKFRHVYFLGPGSFFLSKQNTVILRCEIPGIRDVWMKPSFNDGIPHVTLYDGPSRENSRIIYRIISDYDWNIVARVSAISKIERKFDPGEDFSHLLRESSEIRNDVFGGESVVSETQDLQLLDRITYINKICSYLNKRFSQRRVVKEKN